MNQLINNLLLDVEMLRQKTDVVHSFPKNVSLIYFLLLVVSVGSEIDLYQTVLQRFGHIFEAVSRTDEQHVGEIH